MSGTEFAIHLGQGWYLDANGKLHNEPVESAATYELKGGLPFDPKPIRDAFKDLAGAMPDKNDPKSVAKFAKLGLPKETIEVLSTLGVVAGLTATTLGVAAFVFAVAKMVGFFADPPDPLMAKLDAAVNELRAFSRAEGNEERDRMISEIQSDLTVAINAVKSFLDELATYTFTEAQLQNRLQDMRDAEDKAARAALRATSALSWTRAFDVNEYTGSWFWLSGRLQLHPEDGPPKPFVIWEQADLRVDHRIMVPMALYAVQAYLVLIKAITPEHRSTGQFRDNIRSLANAVSVLATNMRAQGLAKVTYTPEDFALTTHVDVLTANPNDFTAFTNFTVGAVDLANYTDVFLRKPPIDAATWMDAYTGKTTIQRGALEFYWRPPGRKQNMPIGDTSVAWYEDPAACAAAANAIAEQRYIELLASSGYLQLVHQAAQLRHLATEPNVSETVTGGLQFSRSVVSTDVVTAKSPDIPFTGVIEAEANRDRQDWRSRAIISTQPRGRQRKIPYRVLLRSMRLRTLGHAVLDPDYGFDYQTSYEDDPDLPGFKALRVDFSTAGLLWEQELVAMPSPGDPVTLDGTASVIADCFDWYVPYDSPVSRYSAELAQVELMRAGVEADSKHATPGSAFMTLGRPLVPPGSIHDAFVDISPVGFLWNRPGHVDGERRHLAREPVHVNWSLEWQASRLVVTVEGNPEDRNFALFLVTEEKLISGQHLHTSFLMPMNNQITLVPRSFFNEENKAWQRAKGIVDDVNHRFTESERPEPGEPSESPINPADFHIRQGMERVAAYYERTAPDVVQEVLQTPRPPDP